MRNVEKARSTTTKPGTTFEEMLNATRDSLSKHATSDDVEHVEDENDDEDDTILGKLSEDDKPRWLMDIIPKKM
jgi:hypothetical protein